MKEKKIVSISLFSGAGGLDVASFLAGVPVISSTDFDSDCIKTLRMNELFENSEIIEGDLHQIESSVFSEILKKRSDASHGDECRGDYEFIAASKLILDGVDDFGALIII